MTVAVITPAAGRHRHFAMQRKGILAGEQQPSVHVVATMGDERLAELAIDSGCVVVPVPVTDGRLPLAAARNAGAHRAVELGAELLIFLDVDCIPGPSLVQRYGGVSRPTSLLCGPVAYLPPAPGGYHLEQLSRLAEPHPARPAPADGELVPGGDMRLFWSLSFAVTASAWRSIGGFCEQYAGYGAEDTDFGQLAAQAGMSLDWLGGATAYHQYHPTSRPPVQHLDDILRNGRIFRQRWGWWPMPGWFREFQERGLVRYDRATDDWHRC